MNVERGEARPTGVARITSPGVSYARSLLLVRAAWVVLAVIVLGLGLAGVPYTYERYTSVCARGAEACQEGQLTAEGARELRQLGLSVGFYAAYNGVAIPIVVTLVFFAVAAVIFLRRSEDPVALFGSFTLLVFGGAALTGTMHDLADAHPAFWFPANLLDYAWQLSFGVFLYVFPDGRFVPHSTRWLAAAAGLLFAINIFLPGSALDLFRGPFFIVFIGSLVFAQVYRYRCASSPVQRQQTKWVVFGFVLALVGFSLSFALGLLVPAVRSGLLGGTILRTLIYGCVLLVPLSIGMAILRYRLWDIDIVINRTLVYGSLTMIVVGLYMLVVGGVGALLRAEGNLLLSLLGAGLVAILFAPLRDRLQRGVNRLMYGERDEPYRVLSRLGQRLEATLAPGEVLPTIVQTMREALRLPYAAIELRHDGEYTVAASAGRPAKGALRLPLVYHGEEVGQLVLAPRTGEDSFTPSDRRLLQDLARHAGVAAHAVRLTADLQHSRERLVTAREEERRRLRRDLHDGLGPVLAGVTLQVGAIRNLLKHNPDAADKLLIELGGEAEAAVGEVRRLVYGLRPPALDELGLPGAIRARASQYGRDALQTRVDAPECLPPLPAAIEVAAYRIAQEALANVVRHARASTCLVRVALEDGVLRVQVHDDGVGLSPGRKTGVGLHSMRECAEELGGRCVVQSAPGGGTCVLAELPLPKLLDEVSAVGDTQRADEVDEAVEVNREE